MKHWHSYGATTNEPNKIPVFKGDKFLYCLIIRNMKEANRLKWRNCRGVCQSKVNALITRIGHRPGFILRWRRSWLRELKTYRTVTLLVWRLTVILSFQVTIHLYKSCIYYVIDRFPNIVESALKAIKVKLRYGENQKL